MRSRKASHMALLLCQIKPTQGAEKKFISISISTYISILKLKLAWTCIVDDCMSLADHLACPVEWNKRLVPNRERNKYLLKPKEHYYDYWDPSLANGVFPLVLVWAPAFSAHVVAKVSQMHMSALYACACSMHACIYRELIVCKKRKNIGSSRLF